jgi:hypothetical protein
LKDEHVITANGYEIVNLSKPYKWIVRRQSGRIPSETLKTKGKPLAYYVPIRDDVYGSLYSTEYHGFQSHWVYCTNTSVSDLFRDKVLHEICQTFSSDSEVLSEIKRHIFIIVNMLIKSYTFDCIFTDIEALSSLRLSVPVLYSVPLLKSITPKNQKQEVISAMLLKHKTLPLNVFDWQTLQGVSLRNTTLDKTSIAKYTTPLILSATNHMYTGFLYKEFVRMGKKETLPVTLFFIGKG